jgi:hypothetical protein
LQVTVFQESHQGDRLNRHSQFDRVVGHVNQILLGAEISLRPLHGGMTEKHLDLLRFSAPQTVYPGVTKCILAWIPT